MTNAGVPGIADDLCNGFNVRLVDHGLWSCGDWRLSQRLWRRLGVKVQDSMVSKVYQV